MVLPVISPGHVQVVPSAQHIPLQALLVHSSFALQTEPTVLRATHAPPLQ
jgi:hypothetical protein